MNVAVVKKNLAEVNEKIKDRSLFCFLSVAQLIYLFIFKSTEVRGSIQQVGCDWLVAQWCGQLDAAYLRAISNTLTNKALKCQRPWLESPAI